MYPHLTPTELSVWTRPTEVWVEDDEAGEVLRWAGPMIEVSKRAAEDRMFAEFMRLADASSSEIASFAQIWGLLELCDHDLPNTHIPRRSWIDLDMVGVTPCSEIWKANRPVQEPIRTWRRLTGQVRSLYDGARMMAAGDQLDDGHWAPVRDLVPGLLATSRREYLEEVGHVPTRKLVDELDQTILLVGVQRWLNFGDVGFHLRWENGRGKITYGGVGLAGAIALQLALVVSGSTGLFFCSACNLPYAPIRRPRGEFHYCEDCHSVGIPARDRQRRSRAKRRRMSR